jgi:hypothetical protein
MPRVPIPPSLAGVAFTTAQGLAAGLGQGRLRGSDLSRPLHGLRVPGATAHGVEDRVLRARHAARAAALVLPRDGAFSHCTAAMLLGLPLPRAREHLEPLHWMRPSRRNRVARPQVVPHRGLERRRTQVAHGLAVVSPEDTWADLAALLGVEDLVVLGDAVARRAGSLEPLAQALERHRGARGCLRLLEALRWVRTGSDSPMETRSRLAFCRHGLPEPELNVELGAADGSGFLCRSDFVWRQARVIGEYQGAHHFGSFERGDDDITRRHLALDDGWTYLEITRSDHRSPARLHAMLERFARHLGIERVADRPSPDWEHPFPTPSVVCRGGQTGRAIRAR